MTDIDAIAARACEAEGIDLDTLRAIRPTHGTRRDPRFADVCVRLLDAGITAYAAGNLVGCHGDVILGAAKRIGRWARCGVAPEPALATMPMGRPMYDDGDR